MVRQVLSRRKPVKNTVVLRVTGEFVTKYRTKIKDVRGEDLKGFLLHNFGGISFQYFFFNKEQTYRFR